MNRYTDLESKIQARQRLGCVNYSKYVRGLVAASRFPSIDQEIIKKGFEIVGTSLSLSGNGVNSTYVWLPRE